MTPTGYTAELCEHDVPFEAFVLQCARAFGALILMRDESMDAPIPERFEPSNYYVKASDEAQARIARIAAMSDAECEAQAHADYQEAMRKHLEHKVKCEVIRDRLLDMRARVEAWMPPTEDHTELKTFMLEQLDETIKHDGTASSYYRDQMVQQTGQRWRASQLEKLANSLAYHNMDHYAELERTRERNEWIRALRQSLETEMEAGKCI